MAERARKERDGCKDEGVMETEDQMALVSLTKVCDCALQSLTNVNDRPQKQIWSPRLTMRTKQ